MCKEIVEFKIVNWYTQVKSETDTRDVKLASEMQKYVECHKQPIKIKYSKEGCLIVIITKRQQHCNVFSS